MVNADNHCAHSDEMKITNKFQFSRLTIIDFSMCSSCYTISCNIFFSNIAKSSVTHPIIIFATILIVSSPQGRREGGTLRDDTKNGCVADYIPHGYFDKGCRKKCTRQSRKVLWVVLSSLFFK